jgi:hypothetical protein
MDRKICDPYLHILRSVATGIEDDKERQNFEAARFNLYAALETGSSEASTAWLDAVVTALRTLHIDSDLREEGMAAAKKIRKHLKEDAGAGCA